MKQSGKPITNLVTKVQLIQALKAHGLGPGMIVEVHSSLSSFGFVVGGAETVVDALIDVLGYTGTLLMPLQTSGNSEPTYWRNPPIASHLVQQVRETTPVFDKKGSETRGMGAVVENFRRRDGIVVSSHPSCSYAAWGKYAKLLCNRHSLHFSLSEESPTARLTELKGYVLLLGCGYDRCTVMHLAEYRTDCRPILVQGSAVEIEGQRIWKKYLDIDVDSKLFEKIGKQMEEKKYVVSFTIGNAACRLFRADVAVDEAIRYFDQENIMKYYRLSDK